MKNITRIPLLEPDLGENELKYLSKCISDNWISSAGPFIEEFEKKIATYAECKFSVATANATSGLYLSLIVAGVKPGDYVIVPDWTFSATANAVLMIKVFLSSMAAFISLAFSVIAKYPIFSPSFITFLMVVNLNLLNSSSVNVKGIPKFLDVA